MNCLIDTEKWRQFFTEKGSEERQIADLGGRSNDRPIRHAFVGSLTVQRPQEMTQTFIGPDLSSGPCAREESRTLSPLGHMRYLTVGDRCAA
jgi:hypothetical protein